MPLPPLAASERRLARFAEVACWICALVGLAALAAPRLLLRPLHLGGFAPLAPGARWFAAFAGAGMLGLAASLRRTALSPRDERRGFAPLLWTLAGAALSLFISWKQGDAQGMSARPLGFAALGAIAAYLALAFVYFRAAPGVNLAAPIPQPVDESVPKPVTLGVRVAPAPLPEPLAEAPKAAAGAAHG